MIVLTNAVLSPTIIIIPAAESVLFASSIPATSVPAVAVLLALFVVHFSSLPVEVLDITQTVCVHDQLGWLMMSELAPCLHVGTVFG